MGKISQYFSLVTFAHTIFALPFALTGYVYALTSTGTPFEWTLLVKILLCMVFARNAAMGFNRWADRKIDAANPRTANREIPAGKISPRAGLIFVVVNATAFVLTTAFINKLALLLSPVALLIALGYSLTKRFTALAHLVLGLTLAIAPVGAYISVTGSIAIIPLILAVVVLTWSGSFDILYSLQDAQFDRDHNLYSIPAQFSANGAVAISIALHVVTACAVIIIGKWYGGGIFYWAGAFIFIGMLVVQHFVFTPTKTRRIASSFGLINGITSVSYALFFIADMIL